MKLVFHTFAGIEERYLEYEEQKARRKGKKNKLLRVLQLSASLLRYFVR
jgi:hypothetical protein